MDFNPFNSSLFTGAGTPWGAKQEKGPDYGGFNMDPNAYQGFDSSKLRQALMQRQAQRGGAAQAQALAGLSKAGIKGADTGRQLTDLAAQQEQGANELDANLALQDYQSKIQQMAMAQNQYNRGQDWNAMQSQAEDQGRSQLWGNLFNTGATLGGAALGGWMGNKAPAAPGSSNKLFDWNGAQGNFGPYSNDWWKKAGGAM